MLSAKLPALATRPRGTNGEQSQQANKTQPPARPALFAARREIFQVRRPLSFLRRHQIAIAAQHVVLAADLDMVIALRTDAFGPHRRRDVRIRRRLRSLRGQ